MFGRDRSWEESGVLKSESRGHSLWLSSDFTDNWTKSAEIFANEPRISKAQDSLLLFHRFII